MCAFTYFHSTGIHIHTYIHTYTLHKASWHLSDVEHVHFKTASVDSGSLISGTNQKCALGPTE